MGWLCYDIYTSPKKECDRLLNYEDENIIQETLGSCMKGNVYYAAVSRTNKTTNTNIVFAAVFRTFYSPRAKKEPNFGYKDMDETMHPYYYDFPEKYFKLLTPTDNKYAIEWRQRVYKNIEAKKNLAKIKYGDKIQFKSPIETTSGVKIGDTIIIEKKRGYFLRNGYWKWPKKWIPAEFEIIKNK